MEFERLIQAMEDWTFLLMVRRSVAGCLVFSRRFLDIDGMYSDLLGLCHVAWLFLVAKKSSFSGIHQTGCLVIPSPSTKHVTEKTVTSPLRFRSTGQFAVACVHGC